ncbi:TQXA domain-containing protein [Streptomyces sp. RerS4]|uniref:TQXA domain-containing protein n=1 Tax=Streptomyces sp. RerS4 TaxID=2942449 RepID=UPI00201BA577|nr:TQXA domain-containing protein [Streptomyces sp. RerS4]UQX01213.1 thioester domain-containing protein [Streptomyces sp. RerS4]
MSIAVPAPSASTASCAPTASAGGSPAPPVTGAAARPVVPLPAPLPVATAAVVAVGDAGAGGVRGSVRRPLAVALLAAALAAAPGARAFADSDPTAGRAAEGASAVLDGLKTYGQAVLRTGDGSVRQIPAGLYEMRVDGGGMLQTYGVGVAGYAQPQARYTESGWSGSPLAGNAEAGRIRWVLEHSYPQLNDLAGLAKAAGAGSLTAETAAAGTQVAIWRLADGAQVEATDPAAELLADYLQRTAGRLPEPPASLGLDPGRVSGPVSGPVGSRLGPVTVRTGAQSVSVTPDAAAVAMGVRVVDAEGRPLESVGNGTRLYFEVPPGTPDGTASVTVQGSTKVPVGRVFTSGIPAEAQIVAGSSASASTATATAVWPRPRGQASPSGAPGAMEAPAGAAETVVDAASSSSPEETPDDERLATSGSSAATPVIAALAVGLVVLGGMVVLLLRKRPLEGEDGEDA